MTTVFDVAAYITEKRGPMSTMKLQKLVYYAQAWSLVFDDRLMFPEEIQAWANGPVVYELFKAHQGKYSVDASFPKNGSTDNLDNEAKETLDAVLDAYGDLDANQLISLTHSERPWVEARRGVAEFAPSANVISTDVMQEYYSAVNAG